MVLIMQYNDTQFLKVNKSNFTFAYIKRHKISASVKIKKTSQRITIDLKS